MRFKDIPQFIREGTYQVNMPLEYFAKWIKSEQEEMDLQLNPDFQRGHVWTEEQQIAYIEYLLRGGRSGKILYFNCPGYQSGGKLGDFVCVDGLQRTTAILRFLNNEIPAFGYYLDQYEDKLPSMCDVLININELETREEVLKWYIQINDGGTPHTKEEIDRVKQLLKAEREL